MYNIRIKTVSTYMYTVGLVWESIQLASSETQGQSVRRGKVDIRAKKKSAGEKV